MIFFAFSLFTNLSIGGQLRDLSVASRFSAIASEVPDMRRLRAIVPPFGVEEDVRWVEEEVPDEERNDGAVADPSSSPSSQSDPDQEVLVPGVRCCLPPAPPPASKPSMFAIVK